MRKLPKVTPPVAALVGSYSGGFPVDCNMKDSGGLTLTVSPTPRDFFERGGTTLYMIGADGAATKFPGHFPLVPTGFSEVDYVGRYLALGRAPMPLTWWMWWRNIAPLNPLFLLDKGGLIRLASRPTHWGFLPKKTDGIVVLDDDVPVVESRDQCT